MNSLIPMATNEQSAGTARLATWNPRRLVRLVGDLLKAGLTPEKLALSIVLGVVLGVVPVIGATTILCGIAAAVLGLNQPVIQSVNYFVYPLQLALIIPFIRAGEWVFDAPRLRLTAAEIAAAVTRDPLGAIDALWHVLLKAMVAWLAFGLVASAVGYPPLVALLRRAASARKGAA